MNANKSQLSRMADYEPALEAHLDIKLQMSYYDAECMCRYSMEDSSYQHDAAPSWCNDNLWKGYEVYFRGRQYVGKEFFVCEADNAENGAYFTSFVGAVMWLNDQKVTSS